MTAGARSHSPSFSPRRGWEPILPNLGAGSFTGHLSALVLIGNKIINFTVFKGAGEQQEAASLQVYDFKLRVRRVWQQEDKRVRREEILVHGVIGPEAVFNVILVDPKGTAGSEGYGRVVIEGLTGACPQPR